MTDRRPILLSMCNPLSADPAYALYPVPTGSTGYRVWQMLTERTGCIRAQYIAAFDRRNLVGGRKWSRPEASAAAQALRRDESLRGRTILVLGEPPRVALELERRLIEPITRDGATWRQIPHPSGRCLFYNDKTARATVALLLEELYEQSTRESD